MACGLGKESICKESHCSTQKEIFILVSREISESLYLRMDLLIPINLLFLEVFFFFNLPGYLILSILFSISFVSLNV